MKEVTCQDVSRSLSAFVDGELEPSDMLAIRAHLDECDRCASRVAFARASRSSVRRVQRSMKAPAGLHDNARLLVIEVTDSEHRRLSTRGLLSWKFVGPTLAAAGFAFVWGAMSHNPGSRNRLAQPSTSIQKTSGSARVNQASAMPASIDSLVDMLVEQHANPLPPEADTVNGLPQVERYVGVPVRWLSNPVRVSRNLKTKFLGLRVVDLRASKRAAMFQYKINKNRRLSVYVYNPSKISVSRSHLLKRIVVDRKPVYCGYVRGYTVAVTDQHGVGYAVASDLDEQETSKILASVGR